jgi:hypothetical protein
MSALEKIAYNQNRRDEVPNQQLAAELARDSDKEGIQEIVDNLWNKNKNIANDCIKVLYEIGYLQPGLVAQYAEDFVKLLQVKNNRIVWGAAIALSTVAALSADRLFEHVWEIKDAVVKGSVITQDNGIATLAIIASKNDRYRNEIFPFLLNHLQTCRPKDIPQHSEKTLVAVTAKEKSAFVEVLLPRIDSLTSPQVKRVMKVIKQAEAL